MAGNHAVGPPNSLCNALHGAFFKPSIPHGRVLVRSARTNPPARDIQFKTWLMADTYSLSTPPLLFVRSVIRIVHAYNAFHGEIRAAYTFDAGPNAVVYHLAGNSAELLALLLRFYPAPEADAPPSAR